MLYILISSKKRKGIQFTYLDLDKYIINMEIELKISNFDLMFQRGVNVSIPELLTYD